LKRRSPISTTIGAIPGAMPPLIGYAAASGHLNYEAGLLFAILFVWQFPHFYAIAWMYREDYARAGIRMLPVVEPSLDSTARRILWFSFALVPLTLAPKYFEMAGNVYLVGAILLSGMVVYTGIQAASSHTMPHARRVLHASIVYLPVLYGLLAFDS
jgi:protoheme IX farnesyltransferase